MSKIKKHKDLIPRVTLAIKVEDNFVHLIKDTKPCLAFYYSDKCKICQTIKQFFLEFICETHFNELQKTKGAFTTCKEDRLFPIVFPSKENHHSVVYRLPSRDGKTFEEMILLDARNCPSNDKVALRRLKNSLHLMPSENKWKPQIHQVDAANWYAKSGINERALMLHWKVGSGKTDGLLHMLGLNLHQLPAHVTKIYHVVPNTLIDMWHASINTATCFISGSKVMKPMDYFIVGYKQFEKMCAKSAPRTKELIRQMLKTGSKKEMFFLEDAIVVVDESQYFRSATKPMKNVLFALQFSFQTISLTGTMLINDPEDLMGAIAIMKGTEEKSEKKPITWSTMKELEEDLESWRVAIMEKKDTSLVSRTFKNRVHLFDPYIHDAANVEKSYPEIKRSLHMVKMSLPQTFEYLRNQKKEIMIGDIKFESSIRNAYSTLSKRICNSCPWQKNSSPKYMELKKTIAQIGRFPQVIYSRFLENGVNFMKEDLVKQWPNVSVISGETPTSDREEIRKLYNTGKVDILLLSNVGGVGLDLHNTVAMHLYECFENLQSELQASHRVARYNSHAAVRDQFGTRPVVEIHKYISIFPDFDGQFSRQEIKETENLFTKYYGQDIKLTPTIGEKLQFGLGPRMSIGDVLKQLKEQSTKTGSIEEHMTKQNAIKQAEIEPFINALSEVAVQIQRRI